MAGGGLRDINISDSRRQYAHAQQTTGCFSPRQKLIGPETNHSDNADYDLFSGCRFYDSPLAFHLCGWLPLYCTVMLMVCLKMTPAESLACTVSRCAPAAIVTIVSSEPPVFVKIALPSR